MSGDTWEQVGTIEVLRQRIYPLDPNGGEAVMRTTVVVEPGAYPVYRKANAYQWLFSGRVNERNEKISDGLFCLHGGDNPIGLRVTFPSLTYGPEGLAELLADVVCQPGPEQRLRFDLDRGAVHEFAHYGGQA